MRIPVNPELPAGLHCTPNTERSEREIREWWCLPYVVAEGDRWSIYCLDGGAWDRPTWHASTTCAADAVAYAEKLHAIYWGQRSRDILPLPFPYEMEYSAADGHTPLIATLIGPAAAAMALKTGTD